MGCGGIDPGNTYLWLTLGGILLGGGLSFLAAPRRRRRPAVFLALLSAALLSVLAAFFLSGFTTDALEFKLYWLASATVLGYIAFLFWKAAGIPLIFITVIGLSLLWSSVYDWRPAGSGTGICTFSRISEGEGFFRISYDCSEGSGGIDRIDGALIVLKLEVVDLPDYFFLLRDQRIYRFRGFGSADPGGVMPAEGYNAVLRNLLRLPGASVSTAAEAWDIRPGVDYRLSLNAEGEAVINKFIE